MFAAFDSPSKGEPKLKILVLCQNKILAGKNLEKRFFSNFDEIQKRLVFKKMTEKFHICFKLKITEANLRYWESKKSSVVFQTRGNKR